jgi:trk system potassium uptake protein TrkH
MCHYPTQQAIFLGFFHSISAFCNAGFSLFTNNLMDYRTDFVVNISIIVLIVLGGIGFWVLLDLKNLFRKRSIGHNLSQHSKVVLLTTFFLILIGTLSLLLFEWNHTIQDCSLFQKIQCAVFQSVTPRTAGFNTLEIAKMTESSLLLIIILMLIGASPGSCGGGIKTTTFAVIMAVAVSKFTDKRQAVIFNKGIPEPVISKSIAITFLALSFITIACFILLMSERHSEFLVSQKGLFIQVVFEAFSAIGTVGLSMGLTPYLSIVGKLIITFLMFIGRVGPLTVTIALAGAGMKTLRLQYAEEEFWVG